MVQVHRLGLIGALCLFVGVSLLGAQDATPVTTASWVFRTLIANYESPNSEVWLQVTDAKGTRLLRCGQILGAAHAADEPDSPLALSTAQGWWAGAGDIFNLQRGNNALEVTHKMIGEEIDATSKLVLSLPLAKNTKLVVGAAQERPFPTPLRELKLQKPRLEGDDIDYLQFLLSLHGGAVGEIDGVFGPMTEAALKRFQSDAGLKATGATTKETWAALLRWK